MKIDDHTRKQIIRNVLLSLLIYALPIVLMFLSFYLSDQKPWKQRGLAAKTFVNQKQSSYGSE